MKPKIPKLLPTTRRADGSGTGMAALSPAIAQILPISNPTMTIALETVVIQSSSKMCGLAHTFTVAIQLPKHSKGM
jgi:hypothetical protein